MLQGKCCILSPHNLSSGVMIRAGEDVYSVEASGSGEANQMVQHKKKILGSRPPACVNKCLSCRPCMATLVMPPHHTKSKTATTTNFKTSKKYSGDEDDTYYLLSWKCKCGNKVYQP
ncbi:hypothetical protein AG4045_019570 [Apium graveolens]|uniref:Epidermal patterning factor-like protein n=1 Tax=Apium graveolens TaxID=4045 RepID=A0A6L5BAG0_APIGR|nr:hypothetical protein AG4045_019570 [Apium graveolens]